MARRQLRRHQTLHRQDGQRVRRRRGPGQRHQAAARGCAHVVQDRQGRARQDQGRGGPGRRDPCGRQGQGHASARPGERHRGAPRPVLLGSPAEAERCRVLLAAEDRQDRRGLLRRRRITEARPRGECEGRPQLHGSQVQEPGRRAGGPGAGADEEGHRGRRHGAQCGSAEGTRRPPGRQPQRPRVRPGLLPEAGRRGHP